MSAKDATGDTNDDNRVPLTRASEIAVKYAQNVLREILSRKLGNPKSFGETSIRLHFKKGQLELIGVNEHTTFKPDEAA